MNGNTEADVGLQHNIVNLLYSIQGTAGGYLAQLEEGRLGEDPRRLEKAEEMLKHSYEQATAALEVTRRLGLLLRQEPRSSTGEAEASLSGAWRTVEKMLREELRESAAEVIRRIPRCFPKVRMPRKKLEEVLYILAHNGLEAIKTGANDRPPAFGKLVIRAQVGFSVKEEPFAYITLADTGPGISEERLTNLFQPFSSTKPEPRGNGLGLFLVKELISRQGGRVTVASFERFGTTVTIELPIASAFRFKRTCR